MSMVPLRALRNILWIGIWIWELHCTPFSEYTLVQENQRSKFLDIQNVSYSLSGFAWWHRFEFFKISYFYYSAFVPNMGSLSNLFWSNIVHWSSALYMWHPPNIKLYRITTIFSNFMRRLSILCNCKYDNNEKSEVGIQKTFYICNFSFIILQ